MKTEQYIYKGKGKGKGHPRTGHEGPEGEQMYSSTLPSTSVIDVGGWSAPRPGRFTPGKETLYPLYRRLGGPRAGLDGCGKSRPPPGFDPLTVQPVASSYMDWAIPALIYIYIIYPRTSHETLEGEQRHTSTLSLTSTLDRMVVKATLRPLWTRKETR